MKKFALGTIEWDRYTILLFAFHWEYSSVGIKFLTITWYEREEPHWYEVFHYWSLLRFIKYKMTSSFQTIRADIEIWGKLFEWKRTVPKEEELPF